LECRRVPAVLYAARHDLVIAKGTQDPPPPSKKWRGLAFVNPSRRGCVPSKLPDRPAVSRARGEVEELLARRRNFWRFVSESREAGVPISPNVARAECERLAQALKDTWTQVRRDEANRWAYVETEAEVDFDAIAAEMSSNGVCNPGGRRRRSLADPTSKGRTLPSSVQTLWDDDLQKEERRAQEAEKAEVPPSKADPRRESPPGVVGHTRNYDRLGDPNPRLWDELGEEAAIERAWRIENAGGWSIEKKSNRVRRGRPKRGVTNLEMTQARLEESAGCAIETLQASLRKGPKTERNRTVWDRLARAVCELVGTRERPVNRSALADVLGCGTSTIARLLIAGAGRSAEGVAA
jgi:hypothetical protein